MIDRVFDHATEAFAFIDTLDQLSTLQSVVDAMERSLALFGFENFIMTGLPHPGQHIDSLILLKKWPLQWYEVYTRRDYERFDPVIRQCRQSVQPFEWAEAPYDPQSNPEAAAVMQGATEFGMTQGYCLPIHGLNGYEACLSMSGVDLDLSSRTKPALHLMTMYAFERARQLLSPAAHRGADLLTPREREALLWAAAGKSAADTGGILGITERTVTAHIVSACQKLDATNKTQAVARAMQYRLISL
jgi:LuxR family quorum sensing-dependent transcriptional regulator